MGKMRYRNSGGCAKKVLLVDDRRSQLRSMKKILAKIGFMAVTVDSAEEAEHILRYGEAFSMVITDLKMPWLDGLSFCKKAKLIDPDLKIFALSGFIYAFGIHELEDAGFDGVIEKPVDKAQLVKILNGDI